MSRPPSGANHGRGGDAFFLSQRVRDDRAGAWPVGPADQLSPADAARARGALVRPARGRSALRAARPADRVLFHVGLGRGGAGQLRRAGPASASDLLHLPRGERRAAGRSARRPLRSRRLLFFAAALRLPDARARLSRRRPARAGGRGVRPQGDIEHRRSVLRGGADLRHPRILAPPLAALARPRHRLRADPQSRPRDDHRGAGGRGAGVGLSLYSPSPWRATFSDRLKVATWSIWSRRPSRPKRYWLR